MTDANVVDPNPSDLETLLKQQVALTSQLSESLEAIRTTLQKLYTENVWQRQRIEQIRHTSMYDIRADIYDHMQSRQLGYLETLEAIKKSGMSFARFGDGEFRMITRPDFNIRFQQNSPQIRAALRKVLIRPSENLLIGMPEVFFDVHWSTVYSETWHVVKGLISNIEFFGNSHVSRPTMFQQFGRDAVESWRSLWAGRRLTIVSGKGSRFNLSPELFDSAESIDELLSEPQNAFEDIERVTNHLLVSGADVVVISLGPAGTILADRLAAEGIQALDIGHLSASYENIVNKGTFPEHLPIQR